MIANNILFLLFTFVATTSIQEYYTTLKNDTTGREQYICDTQWPLHIRGHSQEEQIGKAK